MKAWIRKKIYTIMLIMIYFFSLLPMYERLVLPMDKRDNILNSVELCWIYTLLSLFAMGNIASYITRCYDKKMPLKFKNMIYIFFNIMSISAVYIKSGFTFASEFGLRYHGLPEGADASFFLCKELIPGYLSGITGEYGPPEVYLFPEEEAEEFDKKFPYKEKLKLPGQLF